MSRLIYKLKLYKLIVMRVFSVIMSRIKGSLRK